MSGLGREKKTITPGLLNLQKSLTLKFHSQPELKREPQMLQGEGHVLSSRKTIMIQKLHPLALEHLYSISALSPNPSPLPHSLWHFDCIIEKAPSLTVAQKIWLLNERTGRER